MPARSAASPLQRRYWPPRFSLRALLLGMTLLCLVFAPVLPELNRNNRIAEQVKIVEEMGGECVFVDRPPSFLASLMRRLWPVKIAHIEHDLLMAEFNARTVDLAKLRQSPDVRGVCFNECLFVVPEDEPEVRLPSIEYVQLQERDDVKGGKPDPATLRRFPAFFPNLRKAQLMGVPQEQEFIDALAEAERLEDLDLWFRPPLMQIDSTPLNGLSNLRRLRMADGRPSLDWSFLTRLEKLEEIEIGSEQQHVGGYHYSLNHPLGDVIPDPCNALIQHKHLRRVMLFDEGLGRTQLEQIVENNDLEVIRVGSWTLGSKERLQASLEVLKNERGLHSLGWVRVEDDGEKLFDILQNMTGLHELQIHFEHLTDAHLRRLREVQSLKRIVLSFDPRKGKVTDEGIALFRQLPVAKLDYGYLSFPMAEGMHRLIDSWPGPHPGMPWRQTDEGVRFLRENKQNNR